MKEAVRGGVGKGGERAYERAGGEIVSESHPVG